MSRKPVGEALDIWPGYSPYPSRESNNDIYPWRITPWLKGPDAFANSGMIQLSNGWQNTNYGLRQSYQNYLSELSMNKPFKPNSVLPGQRQQPQAYAPPSQAAMQNYQQMITGSRQSNISNTGVIAEGVDISGFRTYN